jgi:hypothetical protein
MKFGLTRNKIEYANIAKRAIFDFSSDESVTVDASLLPLKRTTKR